MQRSLLVLAAAALAVAGATAAARAQTCTPEAIAAVIDEAGARLRQVSQESQPRIRARLGELGRKQGWPETESEERGYALLQDDEMRALDDQAGKLLTRLDRLGDAGRDQAQGCARLEEARTTANQLIEVTRAKTSHVLAKLDAALKSEPAAQVPTAAVVPPRPELAPKREAAPGAKTAAPAPAQPPAGAAARQKAPPPPPSSQPSPWDTQVSREQVPTAAAMAELPQVIDPGALGFAPDEIRAAGRGFFGSISAGLASVIDFAFASYGKPTGYILGSEGGGAFLAGLRYGSGTLVTKSRGERKVYWQGPSVGYDFGIDGSRVMFLVYNIESDEELFARFAGIDGSAYLVGGVGITFLKKGKLVLAPIRTGLGLRVGANLGYLKFTPAPSLNPF